MNGTLPCVPRLPCACRAGAFLKLPCTNCFTLFFCVPFSLLQFSFIFISMFIFVACDADRCWCMWHESTYTSLLAGLCLHNVGVIIFRFISFSNLHFSGAMYFRLKVGTRQPVPNTTDMYASTATLCQRGV